MNAMKMLMEIKRLFIKDYVSAKFITKMYGVAEEKYMSYEDRNKYDLLIAILIRICLSNGSVKIKDIINNVKTKYKYPLIQPFSFPEADLETLKSELEKNGVVKLNSGIDIDLDRIGDEKCRYSLSPYAYHWLSIMDSANNRNELHTKIVVCSAIISIVGIIISVLLFALSLMIRVYFGL